MDYSVRNPDCITTFGLASFPFARRYSRNIVWSLFLCLLRCFSSAGSPRIPIDSVYVLSAFPERGCPIRIPTDLGLFAAPRGFSQLIASFFGSLCQGIHLMLLFAWTSLACSHILNCLSFIKHFRLLILFVKRLPFHYFELFFPPFGEIVYPTIKERPNVIKTNLV